MTPNKINTRFPRLRYLCSNKSIHSSVLVFATGAVIALAAAEAGALPKNEIETRVQEKTKSQTDDRSLRELFYV